ncbi:uncharacterized protein LOC135937609 [Cloeon dipterum]|uniref:uncharacterized protein LOC135937609 n=1 Tax=Cloeon dipterum TaxID=197152 RepID=UPI00321FB375
MAAFFEDNKIQPDSQHGFRSARSCTTMLMRTLDDWTAALDSQSGAQVHTVFLDWAKAFDKVPHQRLLSKLQQYGVDGGALKWYADDCTIHNQIRSEDDVEALQEDLAHIDVWCANNGMQLNAKECVVMDRCSLQYVATQRLLGVHLSRNLRWNHHDDVQRKKAPQTLGFAARNLRGCTQRMKRIAYLSLVKPKLFYGTPAWHPSTKTNTEKMIRVQNRALHFIHSRRIPPPNQQHLLSVPAQLVYNDLLYFKKCLAGVTDYDAMARITLGRVHRGDNPLHPRLQQPSARTDLGKNIFDFRVVKEWNDLPPALKDCSAAKFPSLCKAYVTARF